MAQEGVPTLEQSASAIAQAIRGLGFSFRPPEGIAVATFPFDFSADLATHFAAWLEKAGIVCQGFKEIWEELKVLNVTFPVANERLEALTEGVTGALREMLSPDLTRHLDSAVSAGLGPLASLSESAGGVHAVLEELVIALRKSLDGLNRNTSKMAKCVCEGGGEPGAGGKCDLGPAVDAMLAGLGKLFAKHLVQPEKEKEKEKKDAAEAHFTQWEAFTDKIIRDRATRSPGIIGWALDLVAAGLDSGAVIAEKVIGAAEQSAAGSVGDVKARLGKGAGGLADTLWKPFEWLTDSGVATPETTPQRCLAAYLGAIALGMVAHGVAAIGHLQIFGSGGLNLGYISAFIGKLAGFQPLANTISGTLYNAYLGVPLKQLVNSKARPYLPGIGDLTRMRYKRIFGRKPDDPVTLHSHAMENPRLGYTGICGRTPHDPVQTEPPMTFAEAMSYYGYSDKWIKILEDDLYREPMARDLLLMAEVAQFDPAWWAYKVRRLGYSDEDAPIMVRAFQRRASRTQVLDLYRQYYYLAQDGFISPSDFRDRAKVTNLAEMALDFGQQAVEVGLERQEKKDLLATAKASYHNGQIDDKALRKLLDAIFYDPARSKRVFQLEYLKKFHRVYYLTEAETARAALPARRKGFLAGRLTLQEYKAQLILSGMEPDVADLVAGSDNEARQRAQLAEFGRYALPTLRDECLHGIIDVAAYLANLSGAGFPAEYVDDEKRLMVARIARRESGIVRTEQLAAYRRAYVLGLIDGPTLDGALTDAGISDAGREAEHVLLDFQRTAEQERRKAKDAAAKAKELAAEKREQEKAKKEAERAAERVARAAERARKAAEQQRAKDAAALAKEAKAAAKARRPDWPGDVARIQKQIEAVYKNQDSWLPDDVWQLTLDLEDELARPAGPDPIAVDSLIGRTEQALARYVGVTPSAPA